MVGDGDDVCMYEVVVESDAESRCRGRLDGRGLLLVQGKGTVASVVTVGRYYRHVHSGYSTGEYKRLTSNTYLDTRLPRWDSLPCVISSGVGQAFVVRTVRDMGC